MGDLCRLRFFLMTRVISNDVINLKSSCSGCVPITGSMAIGVRFLLSKYTRWTSDNVSILREKNDFFFLPLDNFDEISSLKLENNMKLSPP